MALVHTIDGTAVSSLVEFGTVSELTTAARGGERGGGRITVTDPTGTLDLHGWHSYTLDETECVGRERMFTGRIGGKEIKRGAEGPIGPGRVWECELEDVNVFAHMIPLRGAAAKRGTEMGLDRVAWLLSTTAVGGSFVDTGYVNDTFDREFDPADYRKNYPDEVLDDITGVRGRDWFIFWDYDAEAVALFYNFRDHVILSSTLSISNVAGDADYDTVFPTGSSGSSDDASISRQHDETYSSVLVEYTGGSVYRIRTDTIDEFFHDPPEGRGAVIENSRIGRLATAIAFGDDYLVAHADEKDTLTIPVRLPASKVNLIAAGERIQVKLEHEPGYEDDYVGIRVATKTVSEAGLGEDNVRMYDVVLRCTNSAPANASGAGAPGTDEFPHQPPPNAVHWWSDAFTVLGDILMGDPSGESPTAATLVADQVYTYHVSVSWDAISYGHGLQLGPAPGVLDFDFTDMPDGAGSYTFEGTFTAPDAGHLSNPYHFFGAAAQGPHGHDPVGAVSIWIDPLGWDAGDEPNPPAPGQTIPPGYMTLDPAPDGATTDFTLIDSSSTLVAYAIGSLRIAMNGADLAPGVDFTETDPTVAAVAFTRPPLADAQIVPWAQGG
jgi:hypothetical protein